MKLEEKAEIAPQAPGVYLFLDGLGKVIYVGKASVLRNRLRSYFQAGAGHPPKVRAMLERAADLDCIVTASELEALILEQNLIKKHRPRYNVLLRDDKSYPYLKVTLAERFPRFEITRRRTEDGARYFGPYTRLGPVHETLRTLRRLFPFRTCRQKEPPARSRPCLNYHLGYCPAPCCGLVSEEDYRRNIERAVLFLEGKENGVVRQLKEQMERAARRLEYERAAALRDRIRALEEVTEKQVAVLGDFADRDVVGVAAGEDRAAAAVIFVRGGLLVGKESYPLAVTGTAAEEEAMASFLKQYYGRAFVPQEVLLSCSPGGERQLLEEWLSRQRGGRARLLVPRRGEKLRLAELARQNARLALEEMKPPAKAEEEAAEALELLARELGLPVPPGRIEGYDISHTGGKGAVGSMVVFEGGVSAPRLYRRFRIRQGNGPDDCAWLAEVLRRRFARAKSESGNKRDGAFGRLPDLVVVDGGAGQLASARRAMAEAGYGHILAVGLAKGEELIYLPDGGRPLALPGHSPALKLLQRLRDEAHRFAHTYGRKLHGRTLLRSVLDGIEGIGPARRRSLLAAFGSLEEIESASVEELAAVKGMTKRAARAVYEYFHGRPE